MTSKKRSVRSWQKNLDEVIPPTPHFSAASGLDHPWVEAPTACGERCVTPITPEKDASHFFDSVWQFRADNSLTGQMRRDSFDLFLLYFKCCAVETSCHLFQLRGVTQVIGVSSWAGSRPLYFGAAERKAWSSGRTNTDPRTSWTSPAWIGIWDTAAANQKRTRGKYLLSRRESSQRWYTVPVHPSRQVTLVPSTELVQWNRMYTGLLLHKDHQQFQHAIRIVWGSLLLFHLDFIFELQ